MTALKQYNNSEAQEKNHTEISADLDNLWTTVRQEVGSLVVEAQNALLKDPKLHAAYTNLCETIQNDLPAGSKAMEWMITDLLKTWTFANLSGLVDGKTKKFTDIWVTEQHILAAQAISWLPEFKSIMKSQFANFDWWGLIEEGARMAGPTVLIGKQITDVQQGRTKNGHITQDHTMYGFMIRRKLWPVFVEASYMQGETQQDDGINHYKTKNKRIWGGVGVSLRDPDMVFQPFVMWRITYNINNFDKDKSNVVPQNTNIITYWWVPWASFWFLLDFDPVFVELRANLDMPTWSNADTLYDNLPWGTIKDAAASAQFTVWTRF